MHFNLTEILHLTQSDAVLFAYLIFRGWLLHLSVCQGHKYKQTNDQIKSVTPTVRPTDSPICIPTDRQRDCIQLRDRFTRRQTDRQTDSAHFRLTDCDPFRRNKRPQQCSFRYELFLFPFDLFVQLPLSCLEARLSFSLWPRPRSISQKDAQIRVQATATQGLTTCSIR